MGFLPDIKGWIVGIVGTLAGVLGIFFAGKRAGKNKEKARNLERELERSEKANEVRKEQLDAAAKRPRNRKQLSDRMRSGKF